MNKLRSICVYCGSSKGNHPAFEQDAIALAHILVENKIRLINGGGSIGLMGMMADAVLAAGGECTGVIPQGLQEKEIAHKSMTELVVTADMHSRKLKMVNLSDAFIGFPGGFGTMDEVFETLTWSQLHLHHKPIILYNPMAYYDALIAQADHMVLNGFLNSASRNLLMSTSDLNSLIPMLVSFAPATADKWSY
jgi:uncharacterized protein (TIGR00730 family)